MPAPLVDALADAANDSDNGGLDRLHRGGFPLPHAACGDERAGGHMTAQLTPHGDSPTAAARGDKVTVAVGAQRQWSNRICDMAS